MTEGAKTGTVYYFPVSGVRCRLSPGFQLHRLKGGMTGRFAVSVSGNWRVTFRFEDGHAVEIDYLDYH